MIDFLKKKINKDYHLHISMNIPIIFEYITFDYHITCDGRNVKFKNLKDKSETISSVEWYLYGKYNMENR